MKGVNCPFLLDDSHTLKRESRKWKKTTTNYSFSLASFNYDVDQFFGDYDDFLNFFALDPLLDSWLTEGE